MSTATLSPRQTDLVAELSRLVLAEGFAGLTLAEVAARLHCSRATLYALAPSKTELIMMVVQTYFARAVEVVEAEVVRHRGAPAQVEAYLRSVAAYLASASTQFIVDVVAFGPTATIYERNTAAAAQRIRTLISAGVAQGEFRPVNAAFIAEIVTTTMGQIQRGELMERLGLSDAAAYTQLADMMMHALNPTPSGEVAS